MHILKDVCRGLLHMHSQTPPIAHRDIKIENILLSDKRFKLCDFGSASSETLIYDGSKQFDIFGADTGSKRVDQAFEDFERFTTMMYRPPEMIDKYMKWNVTTKVDIWMLGCVAYTLCYALHPF